MDGVGKGLNQCHTGITELERIWGVPLSLCALDNWQNKCHREKSPVAFILSLTLAHHFFFKSLRTYLYSIKFSILKAQ